MSTKECCECHRTLGDGAHELPSGFAVCGPACAYRQGVATTIRRVREHVNHGTGSLETRVVAGLTAAGIELRDAPRGSLIWTPS